MTRFAINRKELSETPATACYHLVFVLNRWQNLAGQLVGTAQSYSYHNYTHDAVGRLSGDTNMDPWQTTTWASTTYAYNTDDNMSSKTVSVPVNDTLSYAVIPANPAQGFIRIRMIWLIG